MAESDERIFEEICNNFKDPNLEDSLLNSMKKVIKTKCCSTFQNFDEPHDTEKVKKIDDYRWEKYYKNMDMDLSLRESIEEGRESIVDEADFWLKIEPKTGEAVFESGLKGVSPEYDLTTYYNEVIRYLKITPNKKLSMLLEKEKFTEKIEVEIVKCIFYDNLSKLVKMGRIREKRRGDKELNLRKVLKLNSGQKVQNQLSAIKDELLKEKEIDIFTFLVPVRSAITIPQIFFMYNILRNILGDFTEDSERDETLSRVNVYYLIARGMLSSLEKRGIIPITKYFEGMHDVPNTDELEERIILEFEVFVDFLINEAIRKLLGIKIKDVKEHNIERILKNKKIFHVITPERSIFQNISVRAEMKEEKLEKMEISDEEHFRWDILKEDAVNLMKLIEVEAKSHPENIICVALLDSLLEVFERAMETVAPELKERIVFLGLNPGPFPLSKLIPPFCYFGYFSQQHSLTPLSKWLFSEEDLEKIVEGEQVIDENKHFPRNVHLFEQLMILRAIMEEWGVFDDIKDDGDFLDYIGIGKDDIEWDLLLTPIYLYFEWTQFKLFEYLRRWVKR